MFDDPKHVSVTNMQNTGKSGRGQRLFHTTVSLTIRVGKEKSHRWILDRFSHHGFSRCVYAVRVLLKLFFSFLEYEISLPLDVSVP